MERRKDNKGKVLKEGESQRKDGRYQYRWINKNGERKTIYAKDLKSLREQEDQLIRHPELETTATTVYQLAKRYSQLHETTLTPNSYVTQRRYLKLLQRYSIANRNIAEVRLMEAKEFVKAVYKDDYAYGTINNLLSLLRPAFQDAMDDNLVLKNPFSFKLSTVIPNNENEKNLLTKEQYEKLLKFMAGSKIYRKRMGIIVILYETGIRASELCGLTFKDIDLTERSLTISHQLLQGKDVGYYIAKPKSRKGNRTIPLSAAAVEAFKGVIEVRPHVSTEVMVDGYTGFLFVTRNGTPRLGNDINCYFDRLIKAYNREHEIPLPQISPHALRHMFCTRMIESGINIKAVQYMMGHATVEMTLNVYAHATKDLVFNDLKKLIC